MRIRGRSWLWGCLLVAMVASAGLLRGSEATLADFSRVIRYWGVDEGLPGGRVDAVAQAADGHLLVGTELGLFRFDGRRFEEVPLDVPARPGSKWITGILPDPDGGLWFCNRSGEIYRYDEGRTSAVPLSGDIGGRILWCLHPEEGALVAVGQNGKSYLAHLKKEGVMVGDEPLPGLVSAIHGSRGGAVWIGFKDVPIAGFRDGRVVEGARLESAGVSAFVERRSGEVLAIGRTGIFTHTEGDWQKSGPALPLDQSPNFAMEDRDGRIWIGGQEAKRHVLGTDGEWRALGSGRESLPAVVQAGMVDTEGNLWFGSFSGLYQAHFVPFINWTPPVEMPTERVIGLRCRPDGTVWFSGFGGVCRLSPGEPRPEFVLQRPTREFVSADGDEEGRLWLNFNDQAHLVLDDSGPVPVPMPAEDSPVRPFSLAVDHDGVAWISATSGLYRCDPHLSPLAFEAVSGQNGLPPGGYHTLTLRSNGDLLVMVVGHGAYLRPARSEAWSLLTPAGDPLAGVIEHADIDRDGRVWGYVRKASAIGCWDGDRVGRIPLERLGMEEMRVSGVVIDDLDHLWLVTRNHGVAAISCSELLACLEDSSRRPVIDWFDSSSGLGSKGGSFASESIRKGPDGRIWVATNGGISVINPALWEAERQRALPPRVLIDGCTADGNRLKSGPVATAPPGTSRMGVRFAALSFGFPEEIQYRYRLIGAVDDWIDGGSRNDAVFQNLAPGDYRFEVVASNRFTRWSDEPTSIGLTIQPRWWERTAVRVAGVLALLLVLALMVRGRINTLQRRSRRQEEFSRQLIASQEEERGRIARELHDGLGQSLLVVKNLAVLGRQAGAAASAAREQFNEIAGASSEAIEEVRAISRALRPPELDRLGLTEAIRATIKRVSESAGLPITAEIDDLDGCLSPDDEIGLFRILQETLNNIIKHADARTARVEIKRGAAMLELTVADDGRGFDVRSQAPGVGLRSISERSQLMGGRWDVHASPGAGTRVRVRIPVKGGE